MDLWECEGGHRSGRALPRDRHADNPESGRIDSDHAVASLGRSCRSIEHDSRFAAQIEPPRESAPPWLALLYYDIGELQTAESLMERGRWALRSEYEIVAVEAYRHLVYGEIEEARQRLSQR